MSNCVICGNEFTSNYGGQTCSHSCRSNFAVLVKQGKAEKSKVKCGSSQPESQRREQELAQKKNLHLKMKPTVSYKTLRKTNIQAMPIAV